MKRTLLILLFTALSFTATAQIFGTGTVTFNANFSASVSINGGTNTTTLTLTAPSNVWFAVGFGGSNMSSGADVFRTNGTDIVDARSTGRFLPGADTQQDWSIQSNTVNAGVRTMVVTRANNTGDANDFVFNPNAGSLTLMWAHGSSTSYAYHGTNRGATATNVLSTNTFNSLAFDMFPNPATEQLTIQLPNDSNSAKVEVYNYLGQLAFTENISPSKNKVVISNLSSGMYLLKVISEDKIGTKKFIKQ